jgi:hypothetical protein
MLMTTLEQRLAVLRARHAVSHAASEMLWCDGDDLVGATRVRVTVLNDAGEMWSNEVEIKEGDA